MFNKITGIQKLLKNVEQEQIPEDTLSKSYDEMTLDHLGYNSNDILDYQGRGTL